MTPQRLAGILRGRGFSRELADDAAQQAFLIMLARAETFASEQHRTSWLIVVARRVGLKEIRRSLREVAREECRAITPDVDHDALIDARRALESLPANRLVPLVAVAAGWSYNELVEQLGCTYSWVNRGVAEGRARARQLVAA